MSLKTHFKDWAIPGPRPEETAEAAGEGETLDALSGHFRLLQLKDGHRFSTDDLLVAWYGTQGCPSALRCLDLGSGIGTVGMISAWRLAGASFVTVEAQEASVALARRSACINGLESRYEIRQGDFRDAGVLHPEERFDLVTGSPPYFPLGTGIVSDHPQKVACRFEVRGDIRDYCEVASRHLALGGVFACVFPEEQRARVLEAARVAALSVLKIRTIVLKEGEPPLLSLFLMMRLADLPPAMRDRTLEELPLVIRMADGRVSHEYQLAKMSIGFPP